MKKQSRVITHLRFTRGDIWWYALGSLACLFLLGVAFGIAVNIWESGKEFERRRDSLEQTAEFEP
jgi:uncharacterized membrane protein